MNRIWNWFKALPWKDARAWVSTLQSSLGTMTSMIWKGLH